MLAPPPDAVPRPQTIARRAWRIDRAGSLERLRLVEEALPAPATGEVRIRVEAIGLNFADAFACQGLYSATPAGSFVPGLECAGTVEAIGPRPAREPTQPQWRVGDRVIALTRFGGYATAINLDSRYLQPMPTGWSFEQAAGWPVQGLTAWYGLCRLGAIEPGDVVLVQSAAGGVGLAALSLLRGLGATTIGVVGSESKIAFLETQASLPRERIVLRARGARFSAALDAALRAVGADGFDVVFDAVLGDGFRPAFERLAPEGRYILYGAAAFMTAAARPNWLRLGWKWLNRPRVDPLAMISQNRGLLAFNLIWLWEQVERMPEAMAQLKKLAPSPPHLGGVYPFERAVDALAELQHGQTVGKLVLTTGGVSA